MKLAISFFLAVIGIMIFAPVTTAQPEPENLIRTTDRIGGGPQSLACWSHSIIPFQILAFLWAMTRMD